jgi:ketosteroid isomerase-like protein
MHMMRAEAAISGGSVMQKASILSIIRTSMLSIVIVALSVPAFANDADLKKQLEQMGGTYLERFDKQDASGLAAMYATGAIIVDPTGRRTDILKVFEGAFKSGINHMETNADLIWSLGSSDTAFGTGKYRITGNNSSGTPLAEEGLWTATFVREGGQWKIGMLTTIPQPAPAK